MATNQTDRQHALDQLTALDQDRRDLAASVATPWSLLAALGACVAWPVADAALSNPGAGYRASGTGLLAVAAALVILYLLRERTGIQPRHLGGRGWAVAIGVIVLMLAMMSAAFALVSLGLRPVAAVPVLLTWALATWGAGDVLRSALRTLSRG